MHNAIQGMKLFMNLPQIFQATIFWDFSSHEIGIKSKESFNITEKDRWWVTCLVHHIMVYPEVMTQSKKKEVRQNVIYNHEKNIGRLLCI